MLAISEAGKPWIPRTLGLALMVATLSVTPSQGFPEPAAPEAAEAEEGPPPLSSPWQTAQFDLPLERLRAETLALVEADGLTLRTPDDPASAFLTEMVDFDDKRFGADVSVPPPRATYKYPYFQLIEMKSGRYGLEGRFRPLSGSLTRLELRARLETRARDKRHNVMRWVPRYSNGTIERDFFTRLTLALLAAKPSPGPGR